MALKLRVVRMYVQNKSQMTKEYTERALQYNSHRRNRRDVGSTWTWMRMDMRIDMRIDVWGDMCRDRLHKTCVGQCLDSQLESGDEQWHEDGDGRNDDEQHEQVIAQDRNEVGLRVVAAGLLGNDDR